MMMMMMTEGYVATKTTATTGMAYRGCSVLLAAMVDKYADGSARERNLTLPVGAPSRLDCCALQGGVGRTAAAAMTLPLWQTRGEPEKDDGAGKAVAGINK